MGLLSYFNAVNNRIEQNETTREIYRQMKGAEGEKIVKAILDKEHTLSYEYNVQLLY